MNYFIEKREILSLGLEKTQDIEEDERGGVEKIG